MKKLSDSEVQNQLKSIPGWEFYQNSLQINLTFKNFKECMTVVNKIAIESELLNHHPEWTNSYNTLSVKLTTHDVKGISLLDFKLAKTIVRITEEVSGA
ncbi:MAG: 4a-hydroxytetrahydrobiopterin dehydratase [Schleiferiaceae bacterium]|jgi:4a-hydroxytetrahydrobiopterin dehydratase|nr:MAG: 4a-hydroxytetrahydrobiopterin dehydratase [Owenweeksia sp. TMED14]|tara:strand:- start:5559 stop:5855 length:297 start_codon:yes stop_codon:yes gene_type:complete